MAWRQASLGFSQKLRQLGDVRRDPPRFVAGEQLGLSVRFTPETDID